METSGRPSQRRAGIALAVAVVMVILGLTLLSPYLRGVGYLVYWLICIAFTFAALLLAFFDLQKLRQQSREEQRHLIHDALQGLPDPADAPEGKPRPPERN